MKVYNLIERIANTEHETSFFEEDSVERLIYLAYHMGSKQGTIDTSSLYNELLAQQLERANNCRHRAAALEVQGNKSHIYTEDYNNWATELADCETNILAS